MPPVVKALVRNVPLLPGMKTFSSFWGRKLTSGGISFVFEMRALIGKVIEVYPSYSETYQRYMYIGAGWRWELEWLDFNVQDKERTKKIRNLIIL